MPSGSITSTTNTFGMIPGTLTGSVGVPGPQGPTGPTGATGATGPAGPGVATGGTAGQYLTKVDGTNYNTNWTTLDLSTYAPLASPAFTGNPTAPTATFGDNDTSISTTAFVQAALAGGTAVAKNLEVYVRNQTGSTIPAGRIVYISGATGNRPLISLAQANNDANSAQTMGFTKESIANNGFGYVIVRGELENIDTSALTEGVQLYLSPTTAGTWTTTKPSAPQHLVYVGIVVRSHPTLGVILVAVQNGYELNELHDVSITSPSNGQVLKYDSATSLWKNSEDSAPVTSVAGKTGAVTLAVADVSGAAALASPTFTGTPSAPTASAGTSTTQLATTAFVTTADNLKANLASPTFTGTPAAPTAAANTNTTQVATTAYVIGQAASSNPLADGTAAVGTSLRYARQDHVHPTDTTRAPLASPTFTGTVTIPAGASISGYLTTSSAASTYQTQSGMSDYLAKAGNLSGLSSTSTARTNLGLGSLATVNDAPADGSQYARKNNAWEVVSGGGGGAVWGGITGTLSSQTDLNTELGNKASLSGATFTGGVIVPNVGGIANDNLVINRSFSEQNLGFNWADLVSTKVSNISFTVYGSNPEDPVSYDQTINFDFCCPEGFNNIKSVDGNYPYIVFSIYLSGVQQTSWGVSSSSISSTGNSRIVNTAFVSGSIYDVYAEITLGSGLPQQKSRFKIATFSV